MNTKIHKYKISNINDIKLFILSGKAIFTLESIITGRWFTYQVNKKVFKQKNEQERTFYFVSVLTGADNKTAYTYLGIINPKFYLNTTKKSKICKDSISFKALNFFLSKLRKNELYHEINFYHEGVCGKCGKKLTTPDSVSVGLGPICRGYNEKTIPEFRKKKIQNIQKKIMYNKI